MKVIVLAEKRKLKNLKSSQEKPAHHDERIARIRASLDKINNLMAELRSLSLPERNAPSKQPADYRPFTNLES